MDALPHGHPHRRLARGAVAFFLLVATSFVFVGGLVQSLDLPTGIWFVQLVLFLAPSFLFARAFNLAPLPWLRLDRGLGAPVAAAVLLLSVGNYLFAAAWMGALDQLLPESWHIADVEQVLAQEEGLRLAVVLLGVTVLAPLAEEVAFRGFLQRGLVARFGPGVGIALTAVLFSALHADPIGFLPRLELGLVFGWLVWRTGSLWASVIAHGVNNGAATLIFLTVGESAQAADPGTDPFWMALAGAMGLGLLVAAPGALGLLRLTRPTPPEQEPLPRLDPARPVAFQGERPEAWAIAGLVAAVVVVGLMWVLGVLAGVGAAGRAALLAR